MSGAYLASVLVGNPRMSSFASCVLLMCMVRSVVRRTAAVDVLLASIARTVFWDASISSECAEAGFVLLWHGDGSAVMAST